MQLHWDKQMNASYQALARQAPNKAFYWCKIWTIFVDLSWNAAPDLTGATLALPIFHHLLGGVRTSPRLSRLLLVVEKNEKKSSKARQKLLQNYFSRFFA